ncbi:MAG TPA: YbaK/EbsC family protein [Actinomycetota bacterium]|nr:YbaK/EbsC family protein [Actinomycetota bacterium]
MSYVFDYLQGRGVVFTVIPHPRAETAVRGVRALPYSEDEVVKTVVVMADFGPSLMVVPASSQLDLDLAAEATADPDARLATERELTTAYPDYEPGALPPLSMLLLAPMFVDPVVAERDTIVFAAGREDVSIRMETRDLFGTDPVVITPLTAEERTRPVPAVAEAPEPERPSVVDLTSIAAKLASLQASRDPARPAP